MTYLDHKMLSRKPRVSTKERWLLRSFLRGATDITFRPSSPQIKLGSLADDWLAVGDELRAAMRKIEARD